MPVIVKPLKRCQKDWVGVRDLLLNQARLVQIKLGKIWCATKCLLKAISTLFPVLDKRQFYLHYFFSTNSQTLYFDLILSYFKNKNWSATQQRLGNPWSKHFIIDYFAPLDDVTTKMSCKIFTTFKIKFGINFFNLLIKLSLPRQAVNQFKDLSNLLVEERKNFGSENKLNSKQI